MANTSTVYARIDSNLKAMKPTAIGNMSPEELDSEIMKGIESLKSGKTYTPDEVDTELAREFDI